MRNSTTYKLLKELPGYAIGTLFYRTVYDDTMDNWESENEGEIESWLYEFLMEHSEKVEWFSREE